MVSLSLVQRLCFSPPQSTHGEIYFCLTPGTLSFSTTSAPLLLPPPGPDPSVSTLSSPTTDAQLGNDQPAGAGQCFRTVSVHSCCVRVRLRELHKYIHVTCPPDRLLHHSTFLPDSWSALGLSPPVRARACVCDISTVKFVFQTYFKHKFTPIFTTPTWLWVPNAWPVGHFWPRNRSRSGPK